MGHVIDGVRCLHYYSSILVIHGQILQQTVITIAFHKAPRFSPELVIPFYLLAQFLFSYRGVISNPGHRSIRLFSKTFRYVYVALDRSPPDMLRSTVLGLVLAVGWLQLLSCLDTAVSLSSICFSFGKMHSLVLSFKKKRHLRDFNICKYLYSLLVLDE